MKGTQWGQGRLQDRNEYRVLGDRDPVPSIAGLQCDAMGCAGDFPQGRHCRRATWSCCLRPLSSSASNKEGPTGGTSFEVLGPSSPRQLPRDAEEGKEPLFPTTPSTPTVTATCMCSVGVYWAQNGDLAQTARSAATWLPRGKVQRCRPVLKSGSAAC